MKIIKLFNLIYNTCFYSIAFSSIFSIILMLIVNLTSKDFLLTNTYFLFVCITLDTFISAFLTKKIIHFYLKHL